MASSMEDLWNKIQRATGQELSVDQKRVLAAFQSELRSNSWNFNQTIGLLDETKAFNFPSDEQKPVPGPVFGSVPLPPATPPHSQPQAPWTPSPQSQVPWTGSATPSPQSQASWPIPPVTPLLQQPGPSPTHLPQPPAYKVQSPPLPSATSIMMDNLVQVYHLIDAERRFWAATPTMTTTLQKIDLFLATIRNLCEFVETKNSEAFIHAFRSSIGVNKVRQCFRSNSLSKPPHFAGPARKHADSLFAQVCSEMLQVLQKRDSVEWAKTHKTSLKEAQDAFRGLKVAFEQASKQEDDEPPAPMATDDDGWI